MLRAPSALGPNSIRPWNQQTTSPAASRRAISEWRARMQAPDAKEIYKARAATAETVNADGKAHRGLDHVPIRGIEKAFASVSLFVLTYDILRTISLFRGA